ncbi:MAG: hypothetical protein HYY23_08245 [Verrucomicrobia bacterium]|nr:hypothetical protein [Verrucomicrobiota bacterium]
MRDQSHGPGRSAGSALLITLVTTSILGVYLAAYLNLVSTQNMSTMRSVQWNTAIPIAEAGVEEALTHLYYNPMVRTGNGWNLVNGAYRKERVLGSRKYVTSISTNFSPEIISLAYVQKPFSADYLEPPRGVKVMVTNYSTFAKGMFAKGAIELNGYKVTADSYDSADPNYSTDGRYDPAKFKDNGDLGTNSTFTDSLSVWNAKVYGKVSTGPGGSISVSGSGAIGSKAWHAGGNTGVEPGWSSNDNNVSFPDVQPPFTGGALTPGPGVVGLTNYNYVLTSGNWQMSSLSMGGTDKMLVTGEAVLYVTGDVSVSSSAYIYVATNSSLKIYVAGANASFGGKGIANTSSSATNFVYFGLPSNTSISMGGNSTFAGAIYAPSAEVKLGGGGNNIYDFMGACVGGSVFMNGHYNFHYDEALRGFMSRGMVVTAWNEL